MDELVRELEAEGLDEGHRDWALILCARGYRQLPKDDPRWRAICAPLWDIWKSEHRPDKVAAAIRGATDFIVAVTDAALEHEDGGARWATIWAPTGSPRPSLRGVSGCGRRPSPRPERFCACVPRLVSRSGPDAPLEEP